MKKTYIVKDLDCANCAMKIEHQLTQIEGVTLAKVDLIKERIYLEGHLEHVETLTLDRIAKSIENHVSIVDLDQDTITHMHSKIELFINGAGVILLTVLFILDTLIYRTTSPLWLQIGYVISYFLIGYKVIYKAFKNLFSGRLFDEHFLMTIATVGAFVIGEPIEAIAVMLFYRIGEYLQYRSVRKSRKSIKALMDIKPTIAHLIIRDGEKDIRPELLLEGDVIIVRPGEKIPVDGHILDGTTSLDIRHLTGESMPKDVKINDEVISGSINLSGLITVRVDKTYQDSTVAKILQFVESNSAKKAKTEQFITRFANVYTPIVVLLSLLLAFAVPGIISLIENTAYMGLLPIYGHRALIFLVISCPCALVLSVPLSFFAGIGASSKHGMLFKSGSDLEILGSIDHFVFDKTGTLTKGVFEVSRIISSRQELTLEIAAHIEYFSNHPIAKSIVSAYGKKIDATKIKEVHEYFGKGVEGYYQNQKVFVGNDKWMEENRIMYSKTSDVGTIIYVAIDRQWVGTIVIKDRIKKTSKILIDYLKMTGKQTTLITGDQASVGQEVARELGIDHVHTQCLPQEKVRIVSELAKTGKVLFLGDGINDAPVLSEATLGVAMGGIGSDAAIEASDAVIMNEHPDTLISGLEISKLTKVIVMQNIVMALGIKVIVLLLGSFGIATMWMAIFADVGVSLLAVMNAMRIFKDRY
jgi:Cd2+/Zn2+-exporting ATPase